METSRPTSRLQEFKQLGALAALGILLNMAVAKVSQAQEWEYNGVVQDSIWNIWLTPPPDGFGHRESLEADFGVKAVVEYTMGPQGDWEFTGVAHAPLYDGQVIDWFTTCSIRSSVGEYFQMSAQGTLSFEDGEQRWPAPGHPRVAGRNPEIAAHWSEIAIDGTWACSLGATKHESGSDHTADDLSTVLGVVNSVITVVKVLVAAG